MMLINTVILLLRDALPIILIFALLLLSSNKYTKSSSQPLNFLNFFYQLTHSKWWISALLLSLITTRLLVLNLSDVTQILMGKGNEIVFSTILLIIYLMIVFILYLLHKNNSEKRYSVAIRTSVILIFVFVFTVNATNFFTYLTGFWSMPELQFSLLVGIFLGSGICISVGILFYFSLHLIRNKYQQTIIELLLLLFGCGQLIQALNLLLQVDLLPSYTALWDSSFVINEDSELGHFFTALVGYEATPSILHFSVYCSAFILPIAAHYYHLIYSPTSYNLGADNEKN